MTAVAAREKVRTAYRGKFGRERMEISYLPKRELPGKFTSLNFEIPRRAKCTTGASTTIEKSRGTSQPSHAQQRLQSHACLRIGTFKNPAAVFKIFLTSTAEPKPSVVPCHYRTGQEIRIKIGALEG
jgi:hypothetical protein